MHASKTVHSDVTIRKHKALVLLESFYHNVAGVERHCDAAVDY